MCSLGGTRDALVTGTASFKAWAALSGGAPPGSAAPGPLPSGVVGVSAGSFTHVQSLCDTLFMEMFRPSYLRD